MSTTTTGNPSPTDLSMKQQQPPNSMLQTSPIQQQSTQQSTLQPLQPIQTHTLQQQQQPSAPAQRPPLISHKLNSSEINAVRQLVTGYRESAAFLLRSADELETLLLNQNMN